MRYLVILSLLAASLLPVWAQAQRRPDYCATCERDKRGKIKRSKAVLREFARRYPCPANGKQSTSCPGYRINHIVPLACKGKDVVENLEWLTIAEKKRRDAVERKGCREKSLLGPAFPYAHAMQRRQQGFGSSS